MAYAESVPAQANYVDSMCIYSFLEIFEKDTLLSKPEVVANKQDFYSFVEKNYNVVEPNKYKNTFDLMKEGKDVNQDDSVLFNRDGNEPAYKVTAYEFLVSQFMLEMYLERYASNPDRIKAQFLPALKVYLSDLYAKEDIDAFVEECDWMQIRKKVDAVIESNSYKFPTTSRKKDINVFKQLVGEWETYDFKMEQLGEAKIELTLDSFIKNAMKNRYEFITDNYYKYYSLDSYDYSMLTVGKKLFKNLNSF